MNDDALRYETEVDLSAENTSHTQLVLLTGRDKRVLEIGPATGYISKVLRERGCRVSAIEKDAAAAEVAAAFCERIIVGDVEQVDLERTFGDERFDVVMLGDVLEHLIDPRGILEKLRFILAPGGYVVASIPNIGHASVRLMLLDGRFGYTERGVLDHTHLRFFTRSGIQALFEEAGYSIRDWRRTSTDTLEDPFAEGLSLSESELPPHLAAALREDPDALTYQYVVRAYPRAGPARGASRRASLPANGTGRALDAFWRLEERLAEQDNELAALQTALSETKERMTGLEASLAETETELREVRHAYQSTVSSIGYRLLVRVRRLLNWLAPPRSLRRAFLAVPRHGMHILLSEGWLAILRRALPVWRWAPRRLRRVRTYDTDRPPIDEQYQLWLEKHRLTPAAVRAIRREAAALSYRPTVSIIMPVYNSDRHWLRAAIDSVRGQLYDSWELCIADDCSTHEDVRSLLHEYEQKDKRIRVAYQPQNGGISAASNAALALAMGEFVGFLDHDDELKPDALFHVVKLLNEEPDLDFIYTDEDKRAPDGLLVQPFFKPDWSPDLLMSINYVPHFAVYRRQLVEEVGGLRSQCDFSQDYDLALRATERTQRIGHVPLPLYSWRMIPGSAAVDVKAKPNAVAAAKVALRDALQRRGLEGEVHDGPSPTSYRVRYKIGGRPLVSIIIPTRDRVDLLARCVSSIEKKSTYPNYEIVIVDNDSTEEKTLEYFQKSPHRILPYPGPFHFAAMMNAAVREAGGEHVLLLNNDTEVITPQWIEAMLEHSQRTEVAAVGARLFYPDGRRVQHEGIIIGLGGGSAGNVDHGGYFQLGELGRNFSAVTGACLMARRERFLELGGFDESLGVAFNDVDYCLRARKQGYLIVYTPYAVLYHYEGGTRGSLHPMEDERFFRRRWGEPGQYRDPYYNPNLSLASPFSIRLD